MIYCKYKNIRNFYTTYADINSILTPPCFHLCVWIDKKQFKFLQNCSNRFYRGEQIFVITLTLYKTNRSLTIIEISQTKDEYLGRLLNFLKFSLAKSRTKSRGVTYCIPAAFTFNKEQRHLKEFNQFWKGTLQQPPCSLFSTLTGCPQHY